MIGRTNAIGSKNGEIHGAIISVTTDEETLFGKDCFLKKDSVVIETKRLKSTGSCSFIVQDPGDYEISSSDGEQEISEAVTVSNDNIVEKTALPIMLTLYIDGGTVLPVDDVLIWMKCGRVKGKNHTTVEEVIADTETLFLLMSDENAMKYLERSTGFSDAICADEIAMTYLGQSPYVDGTVLNSDIWVSKIPMSPYWNKVSNITITLHGGALETITITGLYGSPTVTTNSDGNVSYYLPIGTFTFSGSVSGQSFERTVAKDTTDVYVMPEGALYWYGYKGEQFEEVNSENGWVCWDASELSPLISPTYNINSIILETAVVTNKNYTECAITTKTKIHGKAKAYITYKIYRDNVFIRANASKSINDKISYGVFDSTTKTTSYLDINGLNAYIVVDAPNGRKVEIYAFWLE